ncbi:MAG TPA: hypothetical protein VK753_07455 [Xanthomonadaceae bacterium]|nr:hypothetical protein [Xanthomonadaceae bacterium]
MGKGGAGLLKDAEEQAKTRAPGPEAKEQTRIDRYFPEVDIATCEVATCKPWSAAEQGQSGAKEGWIGAEEGWIGAEKGKATAEWAMIAAEWVRTAEEWVRTAAKAVKAAAKQVKTAADLASTRALQGSTAAGTVRTPAVWGQNRAKQVIFIVFIPSLFLSS